ncbi:MAG: hypothetical protein JWP82_680 [Humibacillus sp.]|nr:hypothetical protein [Humibacillus sp.]
MDPLPWRDAWDTALYAADRGFYLTRGGPAAHFTTATHGVLGSVLAESLVRLWAETHDRPPGLVVDIGAGRGELAGHLIDALDRVFPAPDTPRSRPAEPARQDEPPPPAGSGAGSSTRVVAVDVVERPDELDERIEWVRSPGGAAVPTELRDLDDVLVVANEWLDVVPCAVVEIDEHGRARTVLVDPATGSESLGEVADELDRAWLDRHWPEAPAGSRIEVGRDRDDAWADLVSRVGSGMLVALDYGHVAAERPSGGTLTAYRRGEQTVPVPDASMDLTAHVAMDTLDADEVVRQREVLRRLGVDGSTPEHGLASSSPTDYLRELERSAAEAELIRPDGFGGFWWAVKRVQATT